MVLTVCNTYVMYININSQYDVNDAILISIHSSDVHVEINIAMTYKLVLQLRRSGLH